VILVSLESIQSFGEKEFDVGEERVFGDAEVFAYDFSLDILGGEEDGVQFLAGFRIGTRANFLAERCEFFVGERDGIHEFDHEQVRGKEWRKDNDFSTSGKVQLKSG